jgi:hypothetical protein
VKAADVAAHAPTIARIAERCSPRQTRGSLREHVDKPDADVAFARVTAAGSALHNDAPLTIGGGSPMFFFDDLGNGPVYIQED